MKKEYTRPSLERELQQPLDIITTSGISPDEAELPDDEM